MKFKKQIKDIILLDSAYNDSWCQAVYKAAAAKAGLNCIEIATEELCIADYVCPLPSEGESLLVYKLGAEECSAVLLTEEKRMWKIAEYEFSDCCAGNSYDKELQRYFVEKSRVYAGYRKNFTYAESANLLNNIQAAREYLTDHEETVVTAAAEDHDLLFDFQREEMLDILIGKIQEGLDIVAACLNGKCGTGVDTAVLCGHLCFLPEIEQEFRKRFPYIKNIIAEPDAILHSAVHKALKILRG